MEQLPGDIDEVTEGRGVLERKKSGLSGAVELLIIEKDLKVGKCWRKVIKSRLLTVADNKNPSHGRRHKRRGAWWLNGNYGSFRSEGCEFVCPLLSFLRRTGRRLVAT